MVKPSFPICALEPSTSLGTEDIDRLIDCLQRQRSIRSPKELPLLRQSLISRFTYPWPCRNLKCSPILWDLSTELFALPELAGTSAPLHQMLLPEHRYLDGIAAHVETPPRYLNWLIDAAISQNVNEECTPYVKSAMPLANLDIVPAYLTVLIRYLCVRLIAVSGSQVTTVGHCAAVLACICAWPSALASNSVWTSATAITRSILPSITPTDVGMQPQPFDGRAVSAFLTNIYRGTAAAYTPLALITGLVCSALVLLCREPPSGKNNYLWFMTFMASVLCWVFFAQGKGSGVGRDQENRASADDTRPLALSTWLAFFAVYETYNIRVFNNKTTYLFSSVLGGLVVTSIFAGVLTSAADGHSNGKTMQIFVANNLVVAPAIVTAWSWLVASIQRGVEEAQHNRSNPSRNLEDGELRSLNTQPVGARTT
jgi:hypothetical protein